MHADCLGNHIAYCLQLSVRDPTQQCCYDDGVKIFPGIYIGVVMKGDIDRMLLSATIHEAVNHYFFDGD